MTRRVLVRAEKPKPWTGRGACTFCSIMTKAGARHDLCPGEIKNAAGAPGSVWRCACHVAGHEIKLE